jgi:hypothetical protein
MTNDGFIELEADGSKLRVQLGPGVQLHKDDDGNIKIQQVEKPTESKEKEKKPRKVESKPRQDSMPKK